MMFRLKVRFTTKKTQQSDNGINAYEMFLIFQNDCQYTQCNAMQQCKLTFFLGLCRLSVYKTNV